MTIQNEQLRSKFSKDEAIRQITEIYNSQYDPNSNLDVYDQLLICESLDESTPVRDNYSQDNKDTPIQNASLNGNHNDRTKLNVIFEVTQNKIDAINQLNKCSYRTPPIDISLILNDFFRDWPSKTTHWLYIAQSYTPKTIKSVLLYLIRRNKSGYFINNPPALFTLIIKRRPKRKMFTNINDIRKQHLL